MISQEQLQHLLSSSLSLLSSCREVLLKHKGCVHVSNSAWDFVSRKFQLTRFPFQSQSHLRAGKLVSLWVKLNQIM